RRIALTTAISNRPATLLMFDREGDCQAAKLRPGNAHSADGWEELLLPEIERQQKLGQRSDVSRRRRLCQAGDLRSAGRGSLGFLVPQAAQPGTTGSLALEPMQRRLRAEALRVNYAAAGKENGNPGVYCSRSGKRNGNSG